MPTNVIPGSDPRSIRIYLVDFATLISTVFIPAYNLTDKKWGFHFLHILSRICFQESVCLSNLLSMPYPSSVRPSVCLYLSYSDWEKMNLENILMWTSQCAKDVECLLSYVLAVVIHYFENSVQIPSSFLIGFFLFSGQFVYRVLYIL